MILSLVNDLLGPSATKARTVVTAHTPEPGQLLVLALDPGPRHTGIALIGADDPEYVVPLDVVPNGVLIKWMESDNPRDLRLRLVAVEQVRSYGGGAGADLYDTVYWEGQMSYVLQKRLGVEIVHLPRQSVAHYVTNGGAHTNDTAVRAAVIARYGGTEIAVGTSKAPGKLYGMRSDVTAAVAVGIAAQAYLRCPTLMLRPEKYEPNFTWRSEKLCK